MKFDKNTKILIVGLGLIGGSYAKALSDEGYFVGAIDKKKSSVEYHNIFVSCTVVIVCV